ncbi:unnamed protein product [Brassica napus]|uniref:(rape) hypothetical protein n=1 Tax=Brassica napus TaxID=3708 RepID=A0A816RM65_BRANA|nr:unnamed protein product [Brassica napus]
MPGFTMFTRVFMLLIRFRLGRERGYGDETNNFVD